MLSLSHVEAKEHAAHNGYECDASGGGGALSASLARPLEQLYTHEYIWPRAQRRPL